MKYSRWCKYLSVVLVGFIFLFSQAGVEAAKKKIAVMPFADGANSGYSQGVCAYATNGLITELVKNKNYEVVERTRMQNILAEQGIGLSGAMDSTTAVKVGKLLGADYVVFGSVDDASIKSSGFMFVNQQSAIVKLSMRIIDNATSAVLFSEKSSGKVSKLGGVLPVAVPVVGSVNYSESIDGSIAEAADEAVVKLADKINDLHPLVGSIIKVQGKTVYLDIGSDQGVREGDTYVIFREGKPIIHPKTGKVLGVERETLGKIKIARVEAEMAVGEANITAQVGMNVKR